MNNHNPAQGNFFRFRSVQHITINIWISRKIHFQQRIVFLFGPERLREIMLSPDPIILPLFDYNMSFDMSVVILL